MRPSVMTPSLMYQRSAPRGAPTCISSSRSNMYLHGRPVSIAPRMASGSCRLSTLPPKPPPTVPPTKCRRVRGHLQQLRRRAEREEQRLRRRVANDNGRWFPGRRWHRKSRSAPARSATSDSGPRRCGQPREGRLDVAVAQLLVVVLVVIDEDVLQDRPRIDDGRTGLRSLPRRRERAAAPPSRPGPWHRPRAPDARSRRRWRQTGSPL